VLESFQDQGDSEEMKVAESTVGERGLTTIPVAIQKALELQKGNKVEWHITNQSVVLKKQKEKKG